VGQAHHANFGVPHGGGRVPVDGAKVPLSVDKRITQSKILSHPHNGVVDRGVPVGMIFTDHITHDPGGFFVGFVPVVL